MKTSTRLVGLRAEIRSRDFLNMKQNAHHCIVISGDKEKWKLLCLHIQLFFLNNVRLSTELLKHETTQELAVSQDRIMVCKLIYMDGCMSISYTENEVEGKKLSTELSYWRSEYKLDSMGWLYRSSFENVSHSAIKTCAFHRRDDKTSECCLLFAESCT
jgi:hypothetical protein